MELLSSSEAAQARLPNQFTSEAFFDLEDLPEPTAAPQQLQDLRSYLTFQSGYLRAQMAQFDPNALVEDQERKRNDLVCDWASQFAIRMREFLFSEKDLVSDEALSPEFLDLRHRIVVFMETLDPLVDLHRDLVDKSFMDRMRPFLKSLNTYLGDRAFWESQRSASVVTQKSVVAPEVIALPQAVVGPAPLVDLIPGDLHVSLRPFHAPLLRLMAFSVTDSRLKNSRQRNSNDFSRKAPPNQCHPQIPLAQPHRHPDSHHR